MKTIRAFVILVFATPFVFADDVTNVKGEDRAWYFAAETCFLSPNRFEGGPDNGASISIAGFYQPYRVALLARSYTQGFRSKQETTFDQYAWELHMRRYFQDRSIGFHVAALARYAVASGAVLLNPIGVNFKFPPYRYQTDKKVGIGIGVGWQGLYGEHVTYGTSVAIGRYFNQVDVTSTYIGRSYQKATKEFSYWEILNVGIIY